MKRSLVLLLAVAGSAAAQQPQPQGRVVFPTANPESVGLSASALTRLSEVLQQQVDTGYIPGAVLAVARNGKLVALKAVGLANIEQEIELSADHLFRIYSMTKPIVAVAAMILVERGQLRLQDPVGRFIPAFDSAHVYAGGSAANPIVRAPARPMTVEHLLTHTSGLSYGLTQAPVDSIYRAARLGSVMRDMARVADSAARLPLAFSPGEGWAYGISTDILGRVVEVASGMRLDDFLEREIFAPLEMRDTRFHISAQSAACLVMEYVRRPAGLQPRLGARVWADYDSSSTFFAGGAGLVSTIHDYLRFAHMLLNGGEFDGRRVLKRESTERMMRNQLPPQIPYIDAIFPRGFGQGFGAAVLVDSARAHLPMSPGTYSWSGNAGTHFWVDREQGLVVVLMLQVQNDYASPLIPDIQRMVYGALRQ